MFDQRIVIRGGGDLGSGVALRLWRSGFPVLILESPQPMAVRRTVSFAEAVYEGRCQVEEAEGRLVTVTELDRRQLRGDAVLVAVDPDARLLPVVRPFVVVDAIMAKRNLGTSRAMASLVVALGPGFTAPDEVDAVVETNRGPNLGRVIWRGRAEENSGRPGEVGGRGSERVLRAPASGALRARHAIGDLVETGDVIADVEGLAVVAPFPALLRGLVRDGHSVSAGMKIGDVDPRLDSSLIRTVSDKALAVAGGVVEAVLSRMRAESE